jgi:NAD(P)H-hydrate epimerase
MIGAPVLAATAALRCGSGLVQLAMPRAVLHAGLSITPELIGLPLAGAAGRTKLLDAAKSADAIVIGPGLGTGSAAAGWLKLLLSLERKIVIDADALNLLARQKTWPTRMAAKAVLTPHPGEMKRLAKFIDRSEVPRDERGRINLAITAARRFRQILVLKGHRTVVSDGKKVYVNRTGDNTLSKAGAGDVLSGITASLLGQGMDAFDAACTATYVHGRAGEAAGRTFGRRGALARDVIDAIPQAMLDYERQFG